MKPHKHKRILSAILIFVFSATSISCNVPINFNQSYNLASNTQLTSPRLQTNFANIINGKRINPHVAAVVAAVLVGISGYPMAAVTMALLWFGGYILYQLTDRPSEHQAVEPEYDAMIYYLRHETKEDALKFIQTVEPHIKRAHAKGKRIVVVIEDGGPDLESDVAKLLRVDHAKSREALKHYKKTGDAWFQRLMDISQKLPDSIPMSEFNQTIFTFLRTLRQEGMRIYVESENVDFREWADKMEQWNTKEEAVTKFFEGNAAETIRLIKEWAEIIFTSARVRDRRFSAQLQNLFVEEGTFVITCRGSAHDAHTEISIPGVTIYVNKEESMHSLSKEMFETVYGGSAYYFKKLLTIPMTQEEIGQLTLTDPPAETLLWLALNVTNKDNPYPPDTNKAMLVLRDIFRPNNMPYQDLVELSARLAACPHILSWSNLDKAMAIYHWMRAKGKISHEQVRRYFPAAERMRVSSQQPIEQQAAKSSCKAMIYYLTHESREDALRLIRTIEEPIRNAHAGGKRVVILFEFSGPFPPSHVPQLLSMDQTKARETFKQATKEILQQCKSFIESPEHPSAFSKTNDFNTTLLLFLKTLRHNGIVVDIEFEEADFDDLVSVYRANELVNEAEINFFRGKVEEVTQKTKEELAVLRATLQGRDRKVAQRLQGLLEDENIFVIAFRGALHNIHAELPKESSFLNQVHAAVDEPTLKTAVGAAEYELKRKLGIAITADEEKRILLSNVVINALLRLIYFSLSRAPEGMQISPDVLRIVLKNILHSSNVSYQDLENLSAHLATNPRLVNSSADEQTMAIYNWMRANGKITDAQAMQYFRTAEQTRRQQNPPDRHRHGGSTITLPLIFLTLGLGATPAVTPVSITTDREISRNL